MFRVSLQSGWRLAIAAALICSVPSWSARPVRGSSQGRADEAPPTPLTRLIAQHTANVEGAFLGMTYSSARARLYAASAGSPNNSLSQVGEINPATGAVERTFANTHQAYRLAVSDDGRYLFADRLRNEIGISGTIDRIDLETGEIDFTFYALFPPAGVNMTLPEGLWPVNGEADSIIVAQYTSFPSHVEEFRVLDHGVARPQIAQTTESIENLTLLPDGTLIGRGTQSVPRLLYRLAAQADGMHVIDVVTLPAEVANTGIAFSADGLAYFADGSVFDPTTETLTHPYAVSPAGYRLGVHPDDDWVMIPIDVNGNPTLVAGRDGQLLGALTNPASGAFNTVLYPAGPGRMAVNDSSSGKVWILTLIERPVAAFVPSLIQWDPTVVVREVHVADRCVSFVVPPTGTALGRVNECVIKVQFRLDGNMVFVVRWDVEFLTGGPVHVVKGSDAGNRNMYALDQGNNRYDHSALTGAAGQLVDFTPGGTTSAIGGYVFPAPRPGATTFRFVNDDQHVSINDIRIGP